MDDPLSIIARHEGVFLRREAIACGYSDKLLASLCRQRILRRVRQGCYCFEAVWATCGPEERHLILARAVLRTTPGPVVLSHVTALIVHGIAVWGADLGRVHVTRLDGGSGRLEKDVVHHVGLCPEPDVTEIAGLPVTVPERALLEAASVLPMEPAVVSADSALHLQLCDEHGLLRRFHGMGHWSGISKIHVMLGLMDGRSESPGETRGRLLFKSQGLPVPDLQFEVYDERGVLVAVTDFVWHEQRAFGEFDGRQKYLKPYRPGETPGDVVFREKQREDLVRGITGYGCGRMIWTDLDRPEHTAAYFRRILGLL